MRVIAGLARGIQLKTPDGMRTRPTADRVKEAMFSIIQFDIPGARVLDLFGGTGQLGIEALSRGAKSAVFVDEQPKACQLIRDNLKKTRLETAAQVSCADYMHFLKNCDDRFDIILLDPPYAEVFLKNSLNLISEIDILQTNGIIVAERPVEKKHPWSHPSFSRSRDYKYGKSLLTIYRKIDNRE